MKDLRRWFRFKVWYQLRIHRRFGTHRVYPGGCPCLPRKYVKQLRQDIADGKIPTVHLDQRYTLSVQKHDAS